MIDIVLGSAVLIAVTIELIIPGVKLYHGGWYNVALVAVAIVLALRLPAAARSRGGARSRTGLVLAAFGVFAVALAGASFGLFAPDPQTIVGAPGTSVNVEGVALHFPLVAEGTTVGGYRAGFLLRPQPRTVVAVDVADGAGRHLTTTQPTGASFLSPVLLMQATQAFGGFDLPYDSFAVPAVHRVVKAVLLTREATERMPTFAGAAQAVLFDVEDEREIEVPHGLGVARDGVATPIGGLTLRATLLSYPAIMVIAIPNPVVVLPGLIAAIVGIFLLLLDGRRTPTVA